MLQLKKRPTSSTFPMKFYSELYRLQLCSGPFIFPRSCYGLPVLLSAQCSTLFKVVPCSPSYLSLPVASESWGSQETSHFRFKDGETKVVHKLVTYHAGPGIQDSAFCLPTVILSLKLSHRAKWTLMKGCNSMIAKTAATASAQTFTSHGSWKIMC